MDSYFVKMMLRKKASGILDNYVQYSMEDFDGNISLTIKAEDAEKACIELGEYLIEKLIDKKSEE